MNNGVQSINGYKWVDTYRNGIKIAGSQIISVSGEVLNVNNTYDDTASVTINGKTIEVGTGDKSPSNPYILQSVENFDLMVTDGAEHTQTINFPYVLRSLPNGAKDYIQVDNTAKTAELVRNVGIKILDGVTEGDGFYAGSGWNDEASPAVCYLGNITDMSAAKVTTNILCDKLSVEGISPQAGNKEGIYKFSNTVFYGFVNKSRFNYIFGDVRTTVTAKIKAWLTTNPIIVQYELETPEITDLNYTDIKTYYPYTQIYTTAEIQPTLTGTFRVWGDNNGI